MPHQFYDHRSVEGDPVSQLRDELVKRGWSAIVAHTGGGCMSVEVANTSDDRTVLIGPDDPHEDIDLITQGGWDLFDRDEYVQSASFTADPGGFVDAAEEQLRVAFGIIN